MGDLAAAASADEARREREPSLKKNKDQELIWKVFLCSENEPTAVVNFAKSFNFLFIFASTSYNFA